MRDSFRPGPISYAARREACALVVGEEGGDRLLHGADAARLEARNALQGVAEVPPLRARDAQQRRVLPHLQSAHAAVSFGVSSRTGSLVGVGSTKEWWHPWQAWQRKPPWFITGHIIS